MTDFSPTLPEILDAALTTRLRGLHTAFPATIVTFDPTTQTATVQPGVHVEVARDDWQSVPPISDVPIVFAGGVAGFVFVPPMPGDGALVVCAEADFAAWLDGQSGEPPVKRPHGLHAIALPGLRPTAGVVPGLDAASVVVGATTGIKLGGVAAVDPIVLELKLRAAITAATTAAGAVVTPSPGAPMTAVFAAFSASFAAALIGSLKVKAE